LLSGSSSNHLLGVWSIRLSYLHLGNDPQQAAKYPTLCSGERTTCLATDRADLKAHGEGVIAGGPAGPLPRRCFAIACEGSPLRSICGVHVGR
jgi:hypothetical protein